MAPAKEQRSAKTPREKASISAVEEAPLSSQDADMRVLSQVEKNLVSVRAGRKMKREEHRSAYVSAMKAIENEINDTFDNHHKLESEAYKQRAQWLAALLERRAAIENNIVACIERLAEANIQATKELGLTVGGRVDMAAEWKANGPASRQG